MTDRLKEIRERLDDYMVDPEEWGHHYDKDVTYLLAELERVKAERDEYMEEVRTSAYDCVKLHEELLDKCTQLRADNDSTNEAYEQLLNDLRDALYRALGLSQERDQARAALEVAKRALNTYANPKRAKEPGDISEFGCGCCAGTIDEDGILDPDGSVAGKTAREALSEIEHIESGK